MEITIKVTKDAFKKVQQLQEKRPSLGLNYTETETHMVCLVKSEDAQDFIELGKQMNVYDIVDYNR